MYDMNNYCCFSVSYAPEDYNNRTRIERMWKGLLSRRSQSAISMHLCPMHMMHGSRGVGSSLFISPDHEEHPDFANPFPPPTFQQRQQFYNWWELETPHAGPELTVTCTPIPERPAAEALILGKLMGEELSWHVPNLSSFFNFQDTLVFIPVELDFQVTPRKAADAWEWMDSFLLRAKELPPVIKEEGDSANSLYAYKEQNKPAHYRQERLMSLYPKIQSFHAPVGKFQCPECGACPDEKTMFTSLYKLYKKDDPEHLRFPAPCCGKVLSFNSFKNDWLGFAKFALQTLAVAHTEDDLEELSTLMGAPFKAVYTHI